MTVTTAFFIDALENCINAQNIEMEKKIALVDKYQETGKIPAEVWDCVETINVKPFYFSEGKKYVKIPLVEISELNLVEDISAWSIMDTEESNGDVEIPVYLTGDDIKKYEARIKQRGIPTNYVDSGKLPAFKDLRFYHTDMGYYLMHSERDFQDLLDIQKASKSKSEKLAILTLIEDRFGAKKPKFKNGKN